MSDIWKKLNLTSQEQIAVINAPHSFAANLDRLSDVAVVSDGGKVSAVSFLLAFVTTLKEVERLAKQVGRKAPGDAIVWFAYPKQTSRRYRCEFHRDTGWQALHEAGFKPVRQVAIDEDWSAIRFRRVEFVKNTRRTAPH
jgi:hypothetical protein